MRVAGIYPLKIEQDPKIQHAVGEPYGLEMILAVARREGHDTELFLPLAGDGKQMDEDEFAEKIVEYKPDVAGFSLYTCQYPAGRRISRKLKERLPGMITVAGNRYPTFLGQNVDKEFDFFVLKEGEETFGELLGAIESGGFENVKGIAYRRNGEGVFTGTRPRNLNLDSLPEAQRFPIVLRQPYRGISIPPLSEDPGFAIMEYSRCCYNNCSFCDNTGYWGNKITFRSPSRVVDEMFRLKEKGAEIFYFMDLNFTSVSKKTEEICNEMIQRKVGASWYCMSNISTVDHDPYLLKLMKDAGCFKIAWGVESSNDTSLQRMNKATGKDFMTNEQCARVLEESMKAGILNQGYYIIGFPWEDQESILRDSEGLRELALHQLNIGIFTPIPLSRFYGEMLEEGYVLDSDLERHDRNTLVYNHKNLDNKTVKKIQEDIHQDFYNSPQYSERLAETCRIDPRFYQSFNDYFSFFGKEAAA